MMDDSMNTTSRGKDRPAFRIHPLFPGYERTAELFYGIVLITGICLVFFQNLGTLPLELWDESRNAVNSMEMLWNGNFLVTHFDGSPDMWNTKPPLLIWLQVLSMSVFGVSEFAVRLPSALAGAALVTYIYFFCRNYTGHAIAGFLSALVLLTSPGFTDFHAARYADYDATLSLFVFLYATQLFLFSRHEKTTHLWLAALFLGCAILTKGIAALLILPGLAFALSIPKEQFSRLFRLKVILIPAAGLLFAMAYYPLRELYNPGYIAAVLENEVTGRFGRVNEGHTGPWWFYFQNLSAFNYRAWIWLIPVAIPCTLFSNDRKIRTLGMFCTLCAAGFLLVISASATKIRWYDAPVYAFFSILNGCLAALVISMLVRVLPPKPALRAATVLVMTTVLLYFPVHYMLKTTVIPERAFETHVTMYGPYMRDFFNRYPGNRKLVVHAEGNNSHLYFYKEFFNHEGRNVLVKTPADLLLPGDTVLACGAVNKKFMEDNYGMKLIHEEGERFTAVITALENVSPADVDKARELAVALAGKIRLSPEWMALVREKARASGIPDEDQLFRDAVYMLQEKQQITEQVARILIEQQ
jgi:4-amino-4-deoxy-L-arabinose transferase-like glycosyltransferase